MLRPVADLTLIIVVACTAVQVRGQSQPRYGSQFLWGAAISAHQVEGSFGGGANSDWWLFEHVGNNILKGDTADIATDHWHRYPEDFAIAKALGLNTIRTSIAWEKIEPAAGVFSRDAIAHYRAEFQLMRAMGLRPLVTLQHGTVPLWFQRRGGWLADDSPQAFVEYVEFVVKSLSDLCDLWATINEPTSLIGEGYFYGNVPPQIASPLAAIKAMLNVIRAHRLATARIHELQPSASGAALRGVGLVNSLEIFDPYRPQSAADIAATALVDELWNWAVPNAAISSGPALERAVSLMRASSRQPSPASVMDLIGKIMADDRRGAAGSPVIDWFGVNYYTRNLIEANPNGAPIFHVPPGPVGDNGWSVYPEGLERIIRAANRRFPTLPVVVTEHGVADAWDRHRPELIRDALFYLDRAKFGHDGLAPIDVRGYFHWSLTDNFEWRYGYAHRFGLVAILYEPDLKRVLRPSASVYQREIALRQ
jgi:beta-glucosidase